MSKLRVLFVGGFKSAAQGGVPGGQVYASRSLIESPLSGEIEWDLLDSTQESLPPPPVTRRAWLAVKRVIRFLGRMFASWPDTVLLFSSSGLSFCEKGFMVLLARAAGRRVVLCPRSGLLLSDYERSRFMRRLIPFVLRRASVVVCQGGLWQRFFQQVSGLPETRLPVIGNSIRTAEYRLIPPLRDRPEVSVLYLGWVEHNKGLFDLVTAVDQRREALTGVRFIICGDGSAMAALQGAIAAAGLKESFELRGWVRGEAKMQALAQCDLLVLPSHREGFPNVLLEAMAAGRAVLASAVGTVPELVVSGETGLLCASRDPIDLGEKLVQLCGDAELRRRCAINGRQRVIEHYDLEQVWRRWLPVLTGVAPDPPSSAGRGREISKSA